MFETIGKFTLKLMLTLVFFSSFCGLMNKDRKYWLYFHVSVTSVATFCDKPSSIHL